jgi:hypothetical protein
MATETEKIKFKNEWNKQFKTEVQFLIGAGFQLGKNFTFSADINWGTLFRYLKENPDNDIIDFSYHNRGIAFTASYYFINW